MSAIQWIWGYLSCDVELMASTSCEQSVSIIIGAGDDEVPTPNILQRMPEVQLQEGWYNLLGTSISRSDIPIILIFSVKRAVNRQFQPSWEWPNPGYIRAFLHLAWGGQSPSTNIGCLPLLP
jgi:hypothetical protein